MAQADVEKMAQNSSSPMRTSESEHISMKSGQSSLASATYENSWMQRWLFDRVHKAVLQLAAQALDVEPSVVLDVGCGTGRLLRVVGTYWPDAQLIGVDPAEGMVAVARRLNPDATFHVGMAEALPLPDYSIDLAFSTLSFHHWQDHAAGICEIARVLRPGGYFILADLLVPRWIAWLIHHATHLSWERQRELFSAAGLKVEAQTPLFSRSICATIGKRPLIQ
jgi:ubiquinone/menaquinone biosynthesis C-methylase UbiE